MPKRVIFFTHPSLFSLPILNQLIDDANIEVVAIVHSTVIMNRGSSQLTDIIKLLQRSGIRYTSSLGIPTSFYHLAAKVLKKPTTKKLAKAHGIPIYKTDDVNSTKAKKFIQSLEADLGICAFFNQIIQPALLDSTKDGFINIHPSLLPRNKGIDPMFYASLRQEDTLGVSIHQITKDIDEGDIYVQKPMPFNKSKSLMYNNYKLFELGSQLLSQVIENHKKIKPTSQHHQGNYDSWPKRAECRKVKNFASVRDTFELLKSL